MERDFADRIAKLNGNKTVVFSLDHNTTFYSLNDQLAVRYTSDSGEIIEHPLLNIEALVEGDAAFVSSDDDWQDKYLPLLTAIESAISHCYENQPGLKDKTVMAVIERLIMKADIKLNDELANTVQASMRLVLTTTSYSMKEVVGCLKKVLRSVKRHHSVDGPTGYLEFIKDKI